MVVEQSIKHFGFPGRVMGKVLAVFEVGKPIDAMAAEVGLQPYVVRDAIYRARSKGFIPANPNVVVYMDDNGQTTTRFTEDFKNERSRARGGVRAQVMPLLLRGASLEEIVANEGDIDPQKITNLAVNARRRGVMLPETAGRKTDQKRAFTFANAIRKAGLLLESVTLRDELALAFQNNGKKWPESLSDRVRVEGFLLAATLADMGDISAMVQYNEIGKSIDEVWFNSSLGEEERLVAIVVDEGKRMDVIHSDSSKLWMYTQASQFGLPPSDAKNVVDEAIGHITDPKQLFFFPTDPHAQRKYLYAAMRAEIRDYYRRRNQLKIVSVDPRSSFYPSRFNLVGEGPDHYSDYERLAVQFPANAAIQAFKEQGYTTKELAFAIQIDYDRLRSLAGKERREANRLKDEGKIFP